MDRHKRRGYSQGMRPILALTLLLLSFAPFMATADFEAGMRAYEAGDFAGALAAWRPLVEAGETEARYRVGKLYEEGKGVARNYRAAAELYRPAAESGHALAQVALGVLYQEGWGVPKDRHLALQWFDKASNQGNPWGQYAVGVWLAFPGDWENRLPATGSFWFELGAKQGLAEAQYELGDVFFSGDGTRPNGKLALYWYRKAAEQGYPRAMAGMDEILSGAFPRLEGDEVETDVRQSFVWTLKAANHGHGLSQLGAAHDYLVGRGVEKDIVEALKWRAIARRAGTVGEVLEKRISQTEFTRAQVAEAERRAAAWRPIAVWRKPLVPPPRYPSD